MLNQYTGRWSFSQNSIACTNIDTIREVITLRQRIRVTRQYQAATAAPCCMRRCRPPGGPCNDFPSLVSAAAGGGAGATAGPRRTARVVLPPTITAARPERRVGPGRPADGTGSTRRERPPPPPSLPPTGAAHLPSGEGRPAAASERRSGAPDRAPREHTDSRGWWARQGHG